MNHLQIPFLMEAILMILAMALGFFLRSQGKPYGLVKLILGQLRKSSFR